MADPECARGGGVSHILVEKRGVGFTILKKMHENSIFSPITGGGRTPGTPYAESATGGHPYNYEPGATLLDFSDRADTDETTPHSV